MPLLRNRRNLQRGPLPRATDRLRRPDRPGTKHRHNTDSRAWRAATIDERRCWSYPLSEPCLAALAEIVQEVRFAPRAITDLSLSDMPCVRCLQDLQPLRTALERGRGVGIIEGIPCQHDTVAELQGIYWLVGQMLGHPCAQNVNGPLLYDVRDTGQALQEGARYVGLLSVQAFFR